MRYVKESVRGHTELGGGSGSCESGRGETDRECNHAATTRDCGRESELHGELDLQYENMR